MKKLILFIGCFIFVFNSYSQFTIGGGYAGTLPLGSFNREGYEFGNGLDIHVLTSCFPRETNYRFQFGFDFNTFNSGEKSNVYRFINDGIVYSANHTFTNSHVGVGLKLRLVKDEERFRHHFDIDFGSRTFSTLKEMKDISPKDNITFPSVSTIKIANNSYVGFTLGSMYKLTHWLFLDLYTRVDFGKSAEWYDLNSLKNINDKVYCDAKTTQTPLLWFGATLSFQIKLNPTRSTSENYPRSPRQDYPRSPPPVEYPTENEERGNNTEIPQEENKTSVLKSIWKIITVIDGIFPKKQKERKPVETN